MIQLNHTLISLFLLLSEPSEAMMCVLEQEMNADRGGRQAETGTKH